MRRHATVPIAFIALLAILTLPSCHQYQDSCKLFIAEAEGGNLKLPPKTWHEGMVGVVVDSFVSRSSRDEVQSFFDDYFASLIKVRAKDGRVQLGYYDQAERIIFFDLKISEDGKKTRFTIANEGFNERSWEFIE